MYRNILHQDYQKYYLLFHLFIYFSPQVTSVLVILMWMALLHVLRGIPIYIKRIPWCYYWENPMIQVVAQGSLFIQITGYCSTQKYFQIYRVWVRWLPPVLTLWCLNHIWLGCCTFELYHTLLKSTTIGHLYPDFLGGENVWLLFGTHIIPTVILPGLEWGLSMTVGVVFNYLLSKVSPGGCIEHCEIAIRTSKDP